METVTNHHRINNPYFMVGGTEELFAKTAPKQVEKARRAIFDQLVAVLPQSPIIWVTTAEIRMVLIGLVARARTEYPNSPIVSLSRLYFDMADGFLDCNRIVDPWGKSLGVGPRPGAIKLSDQIARLKGQFPSRSFIIVDDMLFHGESLEKLMAAGLSVSAIVTAFAIEKGTKKADELGVPRFIKTVVARLLDMVPIHDWLPPLPLCGKVVGTKKDRQMPEPTFVNGLSLCLPYLAPFITPEDVTDWASIPTDKVASFSSVCLEQSLAICEILRQKGVIRTMADLARMNPRASYPIIGRVDPDKSATALLKEALAQLGN